MNNRNIKLWCLSGLASLFLLLVLQTQAVSIGARVQAYLGRTSYFYDLVAPRNLYKNIEVINFRQSPKFINPTHDFNIRNWDILKDVHVYDIPTQIEIKRTVGDYFSMLGATQQANMFYDEVANLQPDDVWADHVEKAINFIEKGNTSGAFNEITNISGIVRSEAEEQKYVYLLSGEANELAGNYVEAAKNYHLYLEHEADLEAQTIIRLYYAQNLVLTQREDEALEELRSAVNYFTFHPTENSKEYHALALFMEGVVYHEKALGTGMGNNQLYETALQYYNESIQVKRLSETYGNRGYIYYHQLGRINDSLQDFMTALDIDDMNDIAWYNRACWEALQGRPESAVKSMTRAALLNWENVNFSLSDSDIGSIRNHQTYKELVAMKNEIELLQSVLSRLGYDPGPRTGELNPATTAAINRVQQRNNLHVTGDVTFDTLRWLIRNM